MVLAQHIPFLPQANAGLFTLTGAAVQGHNHPSSLLGSIQNKQRFAQPANQFSVFPLEEVRKGGVQLDTLSTKAIPADLLFLLF